MLTGDHLYVARLVGLLFGCVEKAQSVSCCIVTGGAAYEKTHGVLQAPLSFILRVWVRRSLFVLGRVSFPGRKVGG